MSFERARRRRLAERREHRPVSAVDLVERHGWWLFPALVVLATSAAFLPTLDNGFVNWDDDRNFLNNPAFRGLGLPQLSWMVTTFPPGGHYIPLTWLTLGLDYQLWGMNPAGYHLTNLLLHTANAGVFYALALRLLAASLPAERDGLARRLGAAAAALLFALHPLRVESVAWVTERRDVLCGLFYLLAVLEYLRACEGGAPEGLWRRPRYWAAVGLATLALLSKTMAVSLPAVLLVLDVYPLERLGRGRAGWWGARARCIIAEKAPFVVLGAAAGALTVAAMAQDLAIASIAKLSGLDRVAISVYSLAFYLWKTVMPLNLSPLYALPARIEPLSAPYVVAGAVVATMSAAALLLWRRRPALAAVWVSYVAILLPVLAIVQTGPQLAADRYTYLASGGWALLAGAGVAEWWARSPRRPQVWSTAVCAVAGIAVVIALGGLTWRQAHVWHDPRSLWSQAIAAHPSAIAHYNLGVFALGEGNLAEATSEFNKALVLDPRYSAADNNLGVVRARQGDLAEATAHFRRALEVNPADADAHDNLGNALARQGDLVGAAAQFREAIALDPGAADAHSNLGSVLAQQGQLDEAIRHYREVLRMRPDDPVSHTNLGMALARQGLRAEAIAHLRQALSIQPGLREAQISLDELLAGSSPTR